MADSATNRSGNSTADGIRSGAAAPTRRTVSRALAWSVPVIALAASAPATAASAPPNSMALSVCRVPVTCTSIFELFPGLVQDKAFAVSYPLTNNTSTSIVLKPSASVTSDGAPFAVVGTIPDYCAPISPGQTAAITMYANSDFDPDTDPAIALGLVLPWGRSCADTDRQPIIIPAETVSSFPACGPTCAG